MHQTQDYREAIRFWETCRIPYNVLLFIIAAVFWGPEIIAGGPREWLGATVVLLMFAAVANLLYCAAYAGEFCFQKMALQMPLQKFRWIQFGAGVAIAVALELWVILSPGMA